ncbi:uncharacterized protein N7484_007562 [Penicillium longicatenatum]|uniref:uncharacterized protein n=1 Tax=Penicillium longicatenatum TaxID=1561947 RepID=UPI0025477F42|nr:uncharacterized protein N7484_007562 [Penicillium longicatenatum]KAJ5639700.1 hypothetical protein N7484_007562 [Penicillium longicatenatum]
MYGVFHRPANAFKGASLVNPWELTAWLVFDSTAPKQPQDIATKLDMQEESSIGGANLWKRVIVQPDIPLMQTPFALRGARGPCCDHQEL